MQSAVPTIKQVTIDNPGTADLLVSSIDIAGTYAAEYRLADPVPALPFTVPAGEHLSVMAIAR